MEPVITHPVSNDEPPTWLWRSAWIALGAVVGLGLFVLVVLAGGAADPPRAGSLVWSAGPLPETPLPVDYTIPTTLTAPYTLEVEGQFSAGSDPNALWEIIGETLGKPSPQFAIVLRHHCFFAVLPMQPDSIPFIHIRPAGEINKLSLDVAADQQATLRINDEIAWRGVIPAVPTATIRAMGKGSSHFVMRRIALYQAGSGA
ncbi:MAG: hypothetical protein IT324_20080 [Anaerolineae bacterium]|nr:hypothetical protein [Anaerolineae bacterium]